MRRSAIFDTYAQQSTLVEGVYVYNSTEGYVQDNWKVNNRLTLDYGVRLVHMQPQHDKLLQASNFFPDEWTRANAPLLYVPGCIGASPCTGNNRNAMNPVTREILTIPGIPNTAAAIGTIIPGTGNLTNGIHQAGQGISKYSYEWPALAFAPRAGAAYDVSGNQRMVIRGGAGLFYDRPHGDSMLATVGNPPYSSSQTVRSATLQTLGSGSFTTRGVPQLLVFQYDADLVRSFQWNVGMQMTLPWASTLDVALVGQHGTSPAVRALGRRRPDQRDRPGDGVPPGEPGQDACCERHPRGERAPDGSAPALSGVRRDLPESDQTAQRIREHPDVVQPAFPATASRSG